MKITIKAWGNGNDSRYLEDEKQELIICQAYIYEYWPEVRSDRIVIELNNRPFKGCQKVTIVKHRKVLIRWLKAEDDTRFIFPKLAEYIKRVVTFKKNQANLYIKIYEQ